MWCIFFEYFTVSNKTDLENTPIKQTDTLYDCLDFCYIQFVLVTIVLVASPKDSPAHKPSLQQSGNQIDDSISTPETSTKSKQDE